MTNTYAKIYTVVRQIPYGKVATYGQIAELAGLFGKPRVVGYALYRVVPEQEIPWHRVINAKGEVSYSSLRDGADHVQRALLEAEEVVFDHNGKVDFKQYRWQPSPSFIETLGRDLDQALTNVNTVTSGGHKKRPGK